MLDAVNSNTGSSEETVHMLLTNGADPNIQNNNGVTALMLAKNAKVIKLLYENNADFTILDNDGDSVYTYLDNSSLLYLNMLINTGVNKRIKKANKRIEKGNKRIEKLENYIRESIRWSPDGDYSELKNLEESFMSKFHLHMK